MHDLLESSANPVFQLNFWIMSVTTEIESRQGFHFLIEHLSFWRGIRVHWTLQGGQAGVWDACLKKGEEEHQLLTWALRGPPPGVARAPKVPSRFLCGAG